MADINVKIIHPTNGSDIDIGLPENMVLRDVFSQLIDANFLSAGQPYTGVLKPSGARKESVPLDNNKTIGENGIGNNDTIQTLIGGARSYYCDRLVNVKIFHPNGDSCVTINIPEYMVFQDQFIRIANANPFNVEIVLKPCLVKTGDVSLKKDQECEEHDSENNKN